MVVVYEGVGRGVCVGLIRKNENFMVRSQKAEERALN